MALSFSLLSTWMKTEADLFLPSLFDQLSNQMALSVVTEMVGEFSQHFKAIKDIS